jgi:transposase InsO family protein
MPWKETVAVDERMRFVASCLADEESMTQLCQQFGISRRVGYKWLRRYEQSGPAGLQEQSRAPHRHPHQVPTERQEQIRQLRQQHPYWGSRKLRAVLEREQPQVLWPAPSTIGDLLRREGLSVPRRRRRRSEAGGSNPLGPCLACNRVWCADYKGWFRTGDGARCDPLTITDGYSRFLLRCQVVARLDEPTARGVFEATFRQYGLPEAIRSDNGQPFASSSAVGGLSRLSVWWVRLGIGLQRIEPGCPQQNGSHERMHLTLKQQTAMPPAGTLRAQQDRLGAFVREYNQDRPHEALGMATPASVYQPSPRAYPRRLEELGYPSDYQMRRVNDRGQFRWKRGKVFLSKALGSEVVGLLDLGSRCWQVKFGPLTLGIFHEAKGRLLRCYERKRMGL